VEKILKPSHMVKVESIVLIALLATTKAIAKVVRRQLQQYAMLLKKNS
jgi:hypothetical protein